MKTNRTSPELAHHRASRAEGDAQFLERALAFELSEDAGTTTAPEWMQIFPAGPELLAVDGRTFKMSDAEAFVAAQDVSKAKPILVDFDHLSSFAPDENGDQTAAGWIWELEVRDGEVWARVDWTIRAAQQIAEREWRFVSPEFYANKKTKEVSTLAAVALVNRPAFQMKALARAQTRTTGDTPMLKAIAAALGLSDDATEEQILTSIQQKDTELESVKASKTPSTKDFMPRADYDRVLARAEEAEGELETAKTAARKDEIETMIASAVTAGKIAPASKAHYVALASSSDDGFDEVKKLTETLPRITDPSALDDAETDGNGLSEDDKEMCAMLGVSEEDYAKQLARDKT